MIGLTISHYTILEKLGEGGMGVVYKAQDTKLDRFVALKFLPHHLSQSEPEKERLLQEAKAAAALNHPNVCSVIDIQEYEGSDGSRQQFIVMEYVEGSTLRNILPVQKVQDALHYAIQIGEALQAAHAKGIVHRDVKSENIMLTSDKRIKVMDFGLAKLVNRTQLTKAGATVGTIAYMSPEQARGDTVDERTDIWSLGVVLYEMLTGQLPFSSQYEQAVVYSILNVDPKPIMNFRSDLPPDLQRIIDKTLQKNPDDRYRSIGDMIMDLRRVNKESTELSSMLLQSAIAPQPVRQHSDKTQQRKLAAIMFTDMVGYSALTQKNEGLALGVLQTHNKLLRSIFPRFKGNEIKSIGDAFLVEFPSALDAVLCAVEIQTILNDYNSMNIDPIQIRIGIHLGDIIIRENDVFGDGVNIAARIEPAAAPGGICISEDVARQVKNKIGYQLVQLPGRQLKNIHTPIQLFALQLPWMPTLGGEHDSVTQELPTDRVPQIPSVGILPFTNLSSDKENEYLADGIAEDLINALSQLRTLRVLSRTSSFALRGSEKDIRSIGQALNIQAIVEGSIRRAGSKIRLSVRLIDIADGFNLWSNSYDREMEDVFAIQDEIAHAIANALRVEMRGSSRAVLVKPQTLDMEAYQLCLKGRYFWAKRPSGIEKALEYFKKALELDPLYTLAMVGLADCYNSLGSWENGSEPPKEMMPLGAAYSQQALKIDDSLSEAHTSKAYSLLHYDRDWSGAENEFKRAIELSPNYSAAHHWHSHLLTALGRTEESLLASRRALELDPLDLVTNVHLAWHYQLSYDYDNALEQSSRTEDLEPNFHWAHFFLGWAYEQKQEFTKAIDSLAKCVRLSGNNTVMLGALGHAYASAGDQVQALRVIKELRDASLRKYVASYEIGVIHAGLGSVDDCFQWLDRAVEEHSGWLVYLRREPRLLQLHSDSRFKALLTKVGLSP